MHTCMHACTFLLLFPFSGEALSAYIFFGPVYYQKLKHMVMDKVLCLITDAAYLNTHMLMCFTVE